MRRFGPLFAFVISVAPWAGAETPPAGSKPEASPQSSEAPTPRAENRHDQVEEAARSYFERALEHYRAGRYHDAIRELDAAFALDPSGKDLAYNLALVHERLGQLREAVAYLRRYVQLESDPAEIASAREAITRIEGARVEQAERAALSATHAAPASAPAASAAGCAEPGRWDGWVTATSGAAVVAMVVGVAFGVGSLMAAPGDVATSSERSIDDVRRASRNAHTYAQVADVAFGVGLLSGAAAGLLYFGRDAGSDGGQALVVRAGATF
jgi:tetratricopeptide (TPR) repeat protein